MCPFLPDSPRLLIRKGKHEEALEVIAALEGHGTTPNSPEVITQYFINSLGISELLARILAAAGSVDYLIFACLAYFVIERYGRRRVRLSKYQAVITDTSEVMMCSAAACSTCWIIIAAAQGRSEAGGDSYKLGIVAVSFFFVFFASFGMGVLGVPWLYPTEYASISLAAVVY